MLTWVTASERPSARAAVNIIVTRFTPHSSAIISVWPTNAGSVSCVASLFIGIVTIPATRRQRASSVALVT